jgi:hypothetical protein
VNEDMKQDRLACLCEWTGELQTLNAVYRAAVGRGVSFPLAPYRGWDEFQARNQLSDALMADLKAAYPDGFESLDAWVGILIEARA